MTAGANTPPTGAMVIRTAGPFYFTDGEEDEEMVVM